MRVRCAIDLFIDDEGGYTTVAVAVALLVSLALVFAAASAEWVMARSYEVQPIADAAAMAGENAVAGYVTIARVIDCCVLSMGLAGLVVLGAGLVMSCIPATASLGAEVCDVGGRILDARQDFAQTSAEGLMRLEELLPAIVVANSAACVAANSDESGISYTGCALPFPVESSSDFSSLPSEVDHSKADEAGEKLSELSQQAKEAEQRANEARHRGWMADCGSTPWCLQERASSLAGLSDAVNPFYPSEVGWTFGAPLKRARFYYAARLSTERPADSSPDELTRSAARKAFYRYALDKVNAGSYVEEADGSVSIELPSLPHNADEVRACSLYTEAEWPCTSENGTLTLHSTLSCPAAVGTPSGTASLASLESGSVRQCDTCKVDCQVMGSVAAASTSTSNGFEHYWREIVEASEDYEQARDEQAQAEQDITEEAESAATAFDDILGQLSVVRPELCPPGAWGCVAVVARQDSTSVPTELTAAFLSSGELPPGAAVSAAALAPDESTTQNNVLASFFDGITSESSSSAIGGALDGVLSLWGRLLVGYGSGFDAVSSHAGDFLDGIDSVFGGSAGAWLKERLKEVIASAGLEPVDMRLMKPVVVGTHAVLEKAGYDAEPKIRSLIESLPSGASAADVARQIGIQLIEEERLGEFTIAVIEIPGTNVSIPLTIDLSDILVDALEAA